MARNRNRNNSGSILGSLTWITLAFIAFCGYLVYIEKWWVVLIIIIVMIIVAGVGFFFFFNEKTTPQQSRGTGNQQGNTSPPWYADLFKKGIDKSGWIFIIIGFILIGYFGGALAILERFFTGKDIEVIRAEYAREDFVADSTKKAKENLKRLQIQEREETRRKQVSEREATKRLKEQLKHERDLERSKQQSQQSGNTRTNTEQDEYGNYKFKDNSPYHQPQDYWYPPDMPPQGPLYQ